MVRDRSSSSTALDSMNGCIKPHRPQSLDLALPWLSAGNHGRRKNQYVMVADDTYSAKRLSVSLSSSVNFATVQGSTNRSR